MSGIGGWLGDTCTVERKATQPDGRRNESPARGRGWLAQVTGQRCRLVVKTNRNGRSELAEEPIVTTYLMLFPADADVRAGDRITAVLLGGSTADAGTYEIAALVRRRSRAAHHLSAQLEKVG